MSHKDYIMSTRRFDRKDYVSTCINAKSESSLRLIHYALGACSEAGEIADIAKKHLAFNKPISEQDLKLEVGDVLWYLTRILDLYGWTFEEVMQANIDKLKKRFP